MFALMFCLGVHAQDPSNSASSKAKTQKVDAKKVDANKPDTEKVAAKKIDVSEAALSAADRKFFETKIRPVLVKHCYECHSQSADELGGKLLIDSAAGMLKGGQSGPALVSGKADASLLIQALRYEGVEMPPESPLPENVVNDFVAWVNRGAPDPRSEASASVPPEDWDLESLWSFLPRQTPAVPSVDNDRWCYDPIDRFVLSRIESSQHPLADDASAGELVRRLYYDLIGLPPTIEQIQHFQTAYARNARQATERLVDELLANEQFGAHWGRHWLDVARYGESNGNDGLGRNASFPHAWRYRDYVVDSFNRDVPYDRFLTEQIAGDLLPASTASERNRQLVATGFLAIGSKPAVAMNVNFAMDIVDDQINTVCTTVLGLSVACARCHDHKHDPVPTRDYYALAGIFASTQTLYGLGGNEKLTAPPTPLHSLVAHWDPNRRSDFKPMTKATFADDYGPAIEKTQPIRYASLQASPDSLKVDPSEKVTFDKASFGAFKGGRLQGSLETSSDSYSVAFWFKNDLPNNKNPITAYLFSRAPLDDAALPGDHLGIGGTYDKERTGKLFVFNGNQKKQSVTGQSVIPPKTWNHVVMVRQGQAIRVYLNGRLEIDAELEPTFGQCTDYCFGIRSDRFGPLTGNMAHVAFFQAAINEPVAGTLYDAAGWPRAPEPVPSIGLAMGVQDKPKTINCKIHINGESKNLGPDEVPRGVLSAYEQIQSTQGDARWAGDSISAAFSLDEPNQSGRLELARWLTNPDHPQTARVMVNRIWLHLFGQAIVETPDDFGVYGARPIDPRLLDYLAQRLIDQDWSIKRMIRSMVLTRTYQLTSHVPPSVRESDPDNRLFARHNRRRLGAEALRDSVLAACGQIDRSPGQGSAVEQTVSLINWPLGESSDLHRKSNHRSIYLCMLRHAPPAELSAFDLPDGTSVVGHRDVTTLPTQALFLMNSPFIWEQSQRLAQRVVELSEHDTAERAAWVFREVLRRDPNATELSQAIDHVRSLCEQSSAAPSDVGSSDAGSSDAASNERLHNASCNANARNGTPCSVITPVSAWASLCQALLSTNEFRYVD